MDQELIDAICREHDLHIYTKQIKFDMDIWYQFYIQHRDKTVWNAEIEEYTDKVGYPTSFRAMQAAAEYYLKKLYLKTDN